MSEGTVEAALTDIRAALEASYNIAECADHPDHLLAAEAAARKGLRAFGALAALRSRGSSDTPPESTVGLTNVATSHGEVVEITNDATPFRSSRTPPVSVAVPQPGEEPLGSIDTRLTEALRDRDGWMRHAQTSDKEVTSLRAIFPHSCEAFLVVEPETETSEETTWCGACHYVGMLVHIALQHGVPLPGALGRLADDLPSSGLRDEIAALAAARADAPQEGQA